MYVLPHSVRFIHSRPTSNTVHLQTHLPLQVRSSIVAKLEPKYQNSSLRAIADSNSLLTRLRVGGGGGGGGGSSQGRAPPTGRERVGHYHRQQRVEARIEARNHATTHEQGATSVDCKLHYVYKTSVYRSICYKSQCTLQLATLPCCVGGQPCNAWV